MPPGNNGNGKGGGKGTGKPPARTPGNPPVQGPVAPPFIGPTAPPFIGPVIPVAPPRDTVTPAAPPVTSSGPTTAQQQPPPARRAAAPAVPAAGATAIQLSTPPFFGPVAPSAPASSTTPVGTVEPHGTLTPGSDRTDLANVGSTASRPHSAGADPHAAQPAAAPSRRRTPSRSAGPRTPLPGPHDVGLLPGSDVLPVVHSLVSGSVSHPETPIALALIVLLFLLVQHRIDRRDPKLAVAPRSEPADLEFGSAIRYA